MPRALVLVVVRSKKMEARHTTSNLAEHDDEKSRRPA